MTRTSSLGVVVSDPPIHHCGRCANPFLSATTCACTCHQKETR